MVLSRNAQPVRPVPRCQSGAQARLRYRVLPSSAGWLHAPSALDDYGAAGAADANSPTDADGHWKDALEALLEPCIAFFWPSLHADIDWNHPPAFLDKELRALAPGRRRNRRYLDKLARVQLKGGAQALLLLHLEIQQRLGSRFARRMYGYFARLQEVFPDETILQFSIVTRSASQGSVLHYHYAPKGQDFLSLSYRVP
ncbi:hypothetical protein J2T28_001703, partial [Kerstersia gyiorum]|nr:hypothetical protein [Kerstersia gyiorum]